MGIGNASRSTKRMNKKEQSKASRCRHIKQRYSNEIKMGLPVSTIYTEIDRLLLLFGIERRSYA